MGAENDAAGDAGPRTNALKLGLLATALSAFLAVAMAIARAGFETPLLAVTLGPAIVAAATLLPPLWARDNAFRQACIGPLALVALLLLCLLSMLGIAGIALVWLFALGACFQSIRVLARQAVRPIGLGLLRWPALWLVTGIVAAIHVHGSKYLNFTADQLLLYGRTDGDVMFHGAILNAFRYFHLPSTGIDGIRVLHYHVGLDAIVATIAYGADLSAILALMVFRAEILFPLGVFALGWGAQVLGQRLLPRLKIGGWPLAAVSAAMLLLVELGTFSGLALPNDPMLLSGIAFTLMAPALFAFVLDAGRPAVGNPGWWMAVVATPFLSALKISTGYLWAAVAGWWALRQLGFRRPAFWVVGVLIAAAFLLGYRQFSDSSGSGAVLFGTPFYVERGFAQGKYWVPLQFHVHAILAFIALYAIRRSAEKRPLRMLAEGLGVAVVMANLPGLLMQILSSTVGSEAWNSRDLKSRPH